MKTRSMVTLPLLALIAHGAAAQNVRSVLQAVAQNIGADELTTLEITGAGGFGAAPGASHSPNDDWPRFELTHYRLQVDFDAGFMREQVTRAQGSYPVLGGSQGVSSQREHALDVALNGDVAWTIAGGGSGPLDREGYMDGIPVNELRRLQILLTPHGFVKAALAPGANPSLVGSLARGSPVNYVSIRALGKYTITAALNVRNEVMHAQTRVANPMFGDMLFETRYGDYAQFGALKYPRYVHHHQGDERLNRGHNALEVRVSDARANGPVEVLTPPDSARQPPQSIATIASERVAEGVWYIGGIRHGSVAVEFEDFVAVVEAPLSEKRAIAVIEEVYRLAPDKPIRYLVNTHHHFDHSGGVRTFFAEGAALVTHQMNREFFENVVLSPAPRTLEPDRLSLLYPDRIRETAIETVNAKYVISDGTRSLDVYVVPPFPHAATMVLAYLPAERIVVSADMYSPPDRGAALPSPNASMRALLGAIELYGLEVDTHVGLHGGIGPHEDLVRIVR